MSLKPYLLAPVQPMLLALLSCTFVFCFSSSRSSNPWAQPPHEALPTKLGELLGPLIT